MALSSYIRRLAWFSFCAFFCLIIFWTKGNRRGSFATKFNWQAVGLWAMCRSWSCNFLGPACSNISRLVSLAAPLFTLSCRFQSRFGIFHQRCDFHVTFTLTETFPARNLWPCQDRESRDNFSPFLLETSRLPRPYNPSTYVHTYTCI